MSVDDPLSPLRRSGAPQPNDSGPADGRLRRKRKVLDFGPYSPSRNSPVLIPLDVSSDLQIEAETGAVIWESIRRLGRPDAQRAHEECRDEWNDPVPRRGSTVAPVVQAPPAAQPQEKPKKFRRRPNQVSVYDLAEVLAAKDGLAIRTADKDRNKQRIALLDQMVAAGPFRTLAQPASSWPEQLDALAQRFPNFHEVIEFIRSEFALRTGPGHPLAFAPFVVHGPPGIGKSVFMEALAGLLRTKLHRVQAETAQHSSCLVGSDKHWSNSETGALFSTLVTGSAANPAIYIDEIDKTGDTHERSIASSLYALLEEGSAKAFRDLSMPEIQLDASRVQWMFAANDIYKVPAAIRSRWQEFAIPTMRPEDARRVVEGIYSDLRKQFKCNNLAPLKEADLNMLSKRPPREMQKLLRRGMAKAVLNKSTDVDLSDLLLLPGAAGTKPASIGFLT